MRARARARQFVPQSSSACHLPAALTGLRQLSVTRRPFQKSNHRPRTTLARCEAISQAMTMENAH